MKNLIIGIILIILFSVSIYDRVNREGFTRPSGKFIPKKEIIDYEIETWGWYGEPPKVFFHHVEEGDAFFFQINFMLKDSTKYGVRYWYDPEKCEIGSIEETMNIPW